MSFVIGVAIGFGALFIIFWKQVFIGLLEILPGTALMVLLMYYPNFFSITNYPNLNLILTFVPIGLVLFISYKISSRLGIHSVVLNKHKIEDVLVVIFPFALGLVFFLVDAFFKWLFVQ
jgi:hypothetical protein